MNYEQIPAELRALPQWVCFMLVDNPERGKPEKIPINPHTLRGASSTNPKAWGTLEKAAAQIGKTGSCKRKGGAIVSAAVCGVGFVFNGNGITGIDFDHVIDEQGQLEPWVADWVQRFGSYTEYSPSGTGLHILCRGALGDRKCIKREEVEIYDRARYFTVTGKPYGDAKPLCDAQAALDDLYAAFEKKPTGGDPAPAPGALSWDAEIGAQNDGLLDHEIISKIERHPKTADLWRGDITGYNSHSEADIALCNTLAFYCRRDTAQMDRLFRQSGLMRDKWDRSQSGSTYGALTVGKAASECRAVYDPVKYRRSKAEKDFKALTASGNGSVLLDEIHPENNDRYTWDDIGNGNLFADWSEGSARCAYETGRWYVYDGRRWIKDPKNIGVMKLCKKLSKLLYKYAGTLEEGDESKKYINFVVSWRTRRKRETIVKDAADVHPVNMNEFDRDPHLFNCKNGTLNLLTGEFRPHAASDMLTMLSNVNYVAGARCERWERFMFEIMEGDQAKIAFLQKAMGYALTGDTFLECFFLLYGATTRNGKTTAVETLRYMLGDYATTIKPESLARKANPDSRSPSEDIAKLAGRRFVSVSEPDNGLVLSVALVKTLTGNDTINARFLGENSFDFEPMFKLFINTNHLPRVTDPTLFASGRVKVIPFNRHFEEHEQDKGLKKLFQKPESLSGILNWCLDGLRRLNEEGLSMPKSIQAATEEYQKASDKMGLFFDEAMVADPFGEVRMELLYPVYRQWCDKNGYKAEAKNGGFKSAVERYAEVTRKRPTGASKYENAVSMALGWHIKQGYENL